MLGERSMARNGYRWSIFADFPGNSSGVRVAIRKTPGGAERFARRFRKLNRVGTDIKLQHDPLLDDVMNARRRTVR